MKPNRIMVETKNQKAFLWNNNPDEICFTGEFSSYPLYIDTTTSDSIESGITEYLSLLDSNEIDTDDTRSLYLKASDTQSIIFYYDTIHRDIMFGWVVGGIGTSYIMGSPDEISIILKELLRALMSKEVSESIKI